MPRRPTAPETTAFARFEQEIPAGHARVLAPGSVPEAAQRRWDSLIWSDHDQSPGPADSFDGAWVADCLEHEEWDRWLLQRMHHALKDGAPVAIRVPDRAAWTSAAGLGFLARRAVEQLRRRIAPGAPPPPFSGRRYPAAVLARMLSSLHYEVVTPPTADGRGGLVTFARKRPGLARRLRAGQAPDPAGFVRDFSAEHARFERIRDGWLASHPSLAPSRVERFDPAAYAGASVLVLAPHADDELVGAAGTLLQLVRNEARVTIVHATDSGASAALLREPDSIRTEVRLAEARRVGEALGVSRLEFWKEDNRDFRVREGPVERLRLLLEEIRPRLVVTPFVTDIHPDHFTLNRVFEAALRGANFDADGCRVLYSEIWSHVPANTVCDVTEDEEEVERLILMYTTAMKVDDLPHLCESRYYFNACRLLGRPGFAEAFHAAPASAHARLMATGGPHLG